MNDYIEDKETVATWFKIDINLLDDYELLCAAYEGDYSCNAFVLLKKNNQLYEVNGSHCSCYGLEDQWEIEETSVESLSQRQPQIKFHGAEDLNWKLITEIAKVSMKKE